MRTPRAGLTIVPVVPWRPPRCQPSPINCQIFTTLFWTFNVGLRPIHTKRVYVRLPRLRRYGTHAKKRAQERWRPSTDVNALGVNGPLNVKMTTKKRSSTFWRKKCTTRENPGYAVNADEKRAPALHWYPHLNG